MSICHSICILGQSNMTIESPLFQVAISICHDHFGSPLAATRRDLCRVALVPAAIRRLELSEKMVPPKSESCWLRIIFPYFPQFNLPFLRIFSIFQTHPLHQLLMKLAPFCRKEVRPWLTVVNPIIHHHQFSQSYSYHLLNT